MMPLYRAALFDLDNTLLNTEEVLDEATVTVMRSRYGVGVTAEALASVRGFVDVGPGSWTRTLLELYGLHLKVADKELRDAVYAECDEYMARALPMPGAVEAVHAAMKHGLKCCIVTSSTADSVKTKRQNHEDTIFKHIAHIVTVEDVVPHTKPHPRPYLMAAEFIGVPIEQCLVFEDSIPGITAGVAAGATVIAVPAPDAREQAQKAGAHYVLSSLENLDWEQLLATSQ